MSIRLNRRSAGLVALALIALAGAAFLSVRISAWMAPPKVERLRIAVPTLPHAALLHIAAANGYFASEGLDVAITPVTHGKAAAELLRDGAVDLGAAAEVPIVIQVMNGQRWAIAASILNVSNENVIVARKDRDITLPPDLPGKRIGVTAGTSGEYYLWAFLIGHKLSPASVTVVDVAPNRIPIELAAGTIDAASTWQPIVFNAQAALGGNAVSFTAANVYTETYVVFGRTDYLKANPVAIERLVRALLKAEEFNRARPEEALNLVAGRLNIAAESLRPTWKDFRFVVDLLQSHLITLEDQARWAMARGHVRAMPVPNFLDNLYLDALLAVRPDRVTVVH